MTLPTSGAISFDDIRAELGVSEEVSLDGIEIAYFLMQPDPPYSLNDLHGKFFPYSDLPSNSTIRMPGASGNFLIDTHGSGNTVSILAVSTPFTAYVDSNPSISSVNGKYTLTTYSHTIQWDSEGAGEGFYTIGVRVANGSKYRDFTYTVQIQDS